MGIFGKPNVEKLKGNRDLKGLHKALRSGEPELAGEAAVALLELEATDILGETLHHELSRDGTVSISRRLAEHGDPRACPLLIDLWQHYENSDEWEIGEECATQEGARVAVLGSLLRMPAPALVSCLRDEHANVRESMARALGGAIGACLITFRGAEDADINAALITCLHDEDAQVRASAARAFRMTEDPDAKVALQACLADEDKDVRAAAAWCLISVADPAAVPALAACLRDEDFTVRTTAIQALGASRSPEAADALADLLGDPDEVVQRAAAHSLADLGDARGTSILVAGTKSDNSLTRSLSLASLEKLGWDPTRAWIEVCQSATSAKFLGEEAVLRTLDTDVTCPSCGETMSAKDAYVPAASFLVCPNCGDDWLLSVLTGRYGRVDESAAV